MRSIFKWRFDRKLVMGMSVAFIPAVMDFILLVGTDFGQYLQLTFENIVFDSLIVKYDLQTLVFVFLFICVGLSQWVYLIPLKYYFGRKTEDQLARGVMIGGVIVFIINLGAICARLGWLLFLRRLIGGPGL
jgi:hypothetical protein